MQRIETAQAPAPLAAYSQAWNANGFLFTSGQVARIPEDNTVDGNSMEQQAERCCQNIAAILEAAGLAFENVIKTTCYLVNMDDFPAFDSVYGKYFVTRPARSCVEVRRLARNYLCEIEVIAAYQ